MFLEAHEWQITMAQGWSGFQGSSTAIEETTWQAKKAKDTWMLREIQRLQKTTMQEMLAIWPSTKDMQGANSWEFWSCTKHQKEVLLFIWSLSYYIFTNNDTMIAYRKTRTRKHNMGRVWNVKYFVMTSNYIFTGRFNFCYGFKLCWSVKYFVMLDWHYV